MRSARVLIVDDNQDLVDALRAVLDVLPGNLGVVTATCGKDALEIAEREGFDVAIVDVKLPDVSGVDLIDPLRQRCPHGEVVLITGFATVDAALGALRSGAFAFVLKSFRPEELLSTVEQALTKVALKREREELERRYRDLVELTDVIVVALDEALRVVLFNPKAAHLTAVPRESAMGRPFLESWIPEADRVRVREALALTRTDAAAREVEADFEVAVGSEPEVVEGEPSRRRVRWHFSRAGNVVYGIGVDVTERKALERRARDNEALSAMGVLAMNLAHEIRNPLNAAVLQLHLLSRNVEKLELTEAQKTSLLGRASVVGDEIARLNRMLTEFLELARPRGILREPVHLGRLLEDVLELQTEAATARGIRIERDLQGSTVAIGDAEKLKQVVINLVVNAIEAMKDGGVLTAKVAPQGDQMSFEIRDTGGGIEGGVIKNVFDPFFTTKEAGTGLGLSIVRKIVDQHGGTVRIESERGKGTAVRVTIPTGR